jgi:Tfp pilus assembly protein PilF
MKRLAILMVVLLPMVLSAAVTETVVPATSESFVSFAKEALDAGDHEAAFLLFERALEMNPRSREALGGRLLAYSSMGGGAETVSVAGL